MNIGADYSFLSLEGVRRHGPDLFLRLTAAVVGPDWKFTGALGRMKVRAETRTLKDITRFAARKTRCLALPLRYGGWVRMRRYRNGHILVRYRVRQAGAGAAIEGRACLTGRSAEDFCSGLGEPLSRRVKT